MSTILTHDPRVPLRGYVVVGLFIVALLVVLA
jgi:hypothetical protein